MNRKGIQTQFHNVSGRHRPTSSGSTQCNRLTQQYKQKAVRERTLTVCKTATELAGSFGDICCHIYRTKEIVSTTRLPEHMAHLM